MLPLRCHLVRRIEASSEVRAARHRLADLDALSLHPLKVDFAPKVSGLREGRLRRGLRAEISDRGRTLASMADGAGWLK